MIIADADVDAGVEDASDDVFDAGDALTGDGDSDTADVAPVERVWAQIGDFPGGSRYHMVSFSIDGTGFAGTGFNGNRVHDDLWAYDATEDSAFVVGGHGSSSFTDEV